MTTCIVCNNDVDEYKINVEIGGLTPPNQKADVRATVCPSCGVMRLCGPDLDYMKGNFPEPTQEQLDSIDIEEIIGEMVLPGWHVGENLRWIDADAIIDEGLEDLYQQEFSYGYQNYGKYNRLVHFILMDKVDREENFGLLRCPIMIFADGGDISIPMFREGRRRFFLLRFLGAKRIPVSISNRFLQIGKRSNIELHESRT